MKRCVIWIAGAALFATANAADPKSIVDYKKSKNLDSSFAARQKEYESKFNEPYRGTVEQNKRYLAMSRVEDALAEGTKVSSGDHLRSKSNATRANLVDAFDGFVPTRCNPKVHAPSNPFMKVIDSVAKDRGGSCCGARFDCSELGDDCLPYLRSQNQSCMKHDFQLRKCGKDFLDLNDPCVNQAHRRLASESTDPVIGMTMHGLSHLPTAMNSIHTGNKLDDGYMRPYFQTPGTRVKTPNSAFPSGFEW